MLKKTTLAILGLVASGFASAGMYSPAPAPSCTPGDVTVPCEARKWDLGVQALYLQPTYSADKGYELEPLGNFREYRPKWGWAYRLEGSYHFNTGNDITMTLIHYDIDSYRRNFLGATPYSLAPVPFNVKLENKFDQVNLILGQHVDMGAWKKARFYGGLQYAKIRVNERNNYTVVPLALVLSSVTDFKQYRNADFYGIGPVIGVDYSYDLAYGFSVTGNTATSILYGSARHAEGYVLGPLGLVTYPQGKSHRSVVPSVEAKLGLKYAYECENGVLNFEGGYQAINYFGALETRRQVGLIHNGISVSNFGLYGPYLGAKWIGNA